MFFNAWGVYPIWFGTIMLLNMQMATISPPFGMILFVMKGVAPPHITMGDGYHDCLSLGGAMAA